MSIEALWAVQFTGFTAGAGVSPTRVAKSGGVIVIETGRLFGGDTWQWYTGTYDRDPKTGRLTFHIQTGVHFTQGGESIFGGALQPQKLVGDVQVSADQQTMTAKLTVVGSPHMTMLATLTRVDELP